MNLESQIKRCSQCKEIKSIHLFSINQKKLRSNCNECRKKDYRDNVQENLARAREYRIKNRELCKKRNRDHYNNNLEYYRKFKATYYSKNREKMILYKLKQYWPNLNHDERVIKYTELLNKQNNLCAICKQPETVMSKYNQPKSLAIDHCHKTNRVRGLLCLQCNKAIGHLKDNPELCKQAAMYLETT